jgi:hypothetical protein
VAGDRLGPTAEGPTLSEAMVTAVARAADEVRGFGLGWPGLDNWADDSPTFKTAPSNPALKEFKPTEVLRHLVDHGHAVAINNEYHVATAAWEDLLGKLKAFFAQEGELAFATFRELSGLTRKLGIPMLEHLDQTGVTVRTGDVRRAGPALEME